MYLVWFEPGTHQESRGSVSTRVTRSTEEASSETGFPCFLAREWESHTANRSAVNVEVTTIIPAYSGFFIARTASAPRRAES